MARRVTSDISFGTISVPWKRYAIWLKLNRNRPPLRKPFPMWDLSRCIMDAALSLDRRHGVAWA